MGIDLDAIRKKVAQLSGVRNSRVQLWKPGLGDHRIRVLPWPDATPEAPFKELYFYYLGNRMPILAPFQFNKPDPINALIKSLYSTKKEDDKELAKKLRPGMRAYAVVLDRADEKQGPIVWAFGKQAYTRMLSFFLDADTEEWTSPGPEGWDLKVSIIPGTGFSKTKIGPIDTAKKQSPLHTDPEQIKKWMSSIPSINDMYPLKSEAEIKAELEAYLAGDEGGPTNESAGQSRGEKPSDDLDKLAKELRAPSAKEIESAEADSSEADDITTAETKKSTKKSAAKSVSKPEPTSESKDYGDLDKAFDSLLNDD